MFYPARDTFSTKPPLYFHKLWPAHAAFAPSAYSSDTTVYATTQSDNQTNFIAKINLVLEFTFHR